LKGQLFSIILSMEGENMKRYSAFIFVACALSVFLGAVTSAHREGHTRVLREIAANMVEIPGGTYMMWATPDSKDKPGHWVKVEPFLLGKYEVTQRQYQAVMGINPSHFRGDPDLPVEQVSWDDCQGFIEKLNALEGQEVYRLPTEAEWEYACLGGSNNASGFCDNADKLSQYAWFDENSGRKTHAVGRLKSNPWGLYDVHGNVWEWCQDWHGEHIPGEVTEPKGLSPAFRVLRGGGYDTPAGDCQSHARRSYSPTRVRRKDMGFRLAATGPVRAIYTKVVQDHPELQAMVTESGFDNLSIEEQQDLIRMVDTYEWLLSRAKDYGEAYPAISRTYLVTAGSLREQIKARFGHVMRE
jgi:formylglycine-generating enzyme required for sulfatase activity